MLQGQGCHDLCVCVCVCFAMVMCVRVWPSSTASTATLALSLLLLLHLSSLHQPHLCQHFQQVCDEAERVMARLKLVPSPELRTRTVKETVTAMTNNLGVLGAVLNVYGGHVARCSLLASVMCVYSVDV